MIEDKQMEDMGFKKEEPKKTPSGITVFNSKDRAILDPSHIIGVFHKNDVEQHTLKDIYTASKYSVKELRRLLRIIDGIEGGLIEGKDLTVLLPLTENAPVLIVPLSKFSKNVYALAPCRGEYLKDAE